MNYDTTLDFLHIISGTDNTIKREYTEAVNNMKDSDKFLSKVKIFMTDMERLITTKKVKDKRISDSAGNIKKLKTYDSIKDAFTIINKNTTGISLVKDLELILKKIEDFQPLYTRAYDKKIRLVQMEYENSVYILITGLSLILANFIDLEQNKYTIRIKRRVGVKGFKVTEKAIINLAKELSYFKHKEYLESLVDEIDNKVVDSEIKESYSYMESSVTDTLDLLAHLVKTSFSLGKSIKGSFDLIRRTLFGILPIIRSIIYLRYKRKADTINSLEAQIIDIKNNIEQLQNIKGLDEEKKKEIIKRQEAICVAYRKKADKLIAQLTETEKEATEDINKSNTTIKNTDTSINDDFVLESFLDVFKKSNSQQSGPFKKSFTLADIKDDSIKELYTKLLNDTFEALSTMKDHEEFGKYVSSEQIQALINRLNVYKYSDFFLHQPIGFINYDGEKNEGYLMTYLSDEFVCPYSTNADEVFITLMDYVKQKIKNSEACIALNLEPKFFSRNDDGNSINVCIRCYTDNIDSVVRVYNSLNEKIHTTESTEINTQVNENIVTAIEGMFNETMKKAISLKVDSINNSDPIEKRTVSKFGGVPYWPKSKPYNLKEMVMLAQINFEEMPELEGFPTKGILQFYIDNMDSSHGTTYATRVIYHQDIEEEYADIDKTVFDASDDDVPYTQVMYISGSLRNTVPNYWLDIKYRDTVVKFINSALGVSYESFNSIPKNILDEFDRTYETMSKSKGFESTRSHIGGHWTTIQYPPEEVVEGQYSELLLQIDSSTSNNIKWGDYGIGSWFINKDNLLNRDFVDKVFFYWDCH